MRHAWRILLIFAALISSAAGVRAQSSFWRQLDQPFGGDIISFVAGYDGSILASAPIDGIMRSTDDGLTWSRFGPGRDVRAILSSGRRKLFGIDNERGWLYRAEDTAGVWTGLPFAPRWELAPMIETSSGAIILAGENGIDRSTDDGITWANVAPSHGLFRFPVRGVGATLYAVADRADVYRSSDDGLTWTFAGVLSDAQVIVALQPLDDGSLVVGTYDGLFRSTDSGRSYVRLAIDGTNLKPGGLARLDAETVVAATTRGAFLIDNDGTTTPINGVPPVQLAAVHVTRTGVILLGYGGRGIYRSTNRGEAFDAVGLPHGWDVVHLNEAPGGVMFASASGSALNPQASAFFRSTDRGATWTDLRLYGGHPYLVLALRDRVLMGIGGESLYRSTDNGITWSSHAKPDELYDVVVARDGAIVGSTNRGILRSTDDGDTWTGAAETEHLYDIAASPDGEIWAIGTKLHRSTDDGRTWTERPITAPRFQYGGYRSIALPVVGVIVMVAWESLPTVARSTDGGVTWDTTGFRCQYGATELADFGPLGMYIVSDCGVAMSRDAGATWSVLAPKPRGERWGTVLAHSSGDIYFAGWTGIHVGTPPSGVRSTETAQLEQPALAARATAAGTAVECRLPRPAEILLTLTSIRGEHVSTLFSGRLTEGTHRFDIDERLPAGAYLVSLRSSGATRTLLIAIPR